MARMLAKNPEDRPQTPREAADALLPFARGKSAYVPAPATSPLHPSAAGRGINGRMWGGIAAVLLRCSASAAGRRDCFPGAANPGHVRLILSQFRVLRRK